MGAALRRDGRAAAYEGTGVGVRGRARRRRAVEARGGRFGCFWRCPHGRRLVEATPGLVRLEMQQGASSSGMSLSFLRRTSRCRACHGSVGAFEAPDPTRMAVVLE